MGRDLSEMWAICHDCPYFEVCEPPYSCAVTENKYRKTKRVKMDKDDLCKRTDE